MTDPIEDILSDLINDYASDNHFFKNNDIGKAATLIRQHYEKKMLVNDNEYIKIKKSDWDLIKLMIEPK